MLSGEAPPPMAVNQTLHGHTFLALWTLIQGSEDLFKALNVTFGLFQVLFEPLSQLLGGGSFGHLRKRFDQLVLVSSD
jgi:hypothetical protein